MPQDLFEQLAKTPVPPVPVAFNRALHDRINRRLLVGQLLDLGLKAIVYTALHFGRAVVGVLMFTAVGEYHEPKAKS